MNLDLETTGPSSSTGTLELSALRSDVRLDSVVSFRIVNGGAVSEVPGSLAGTLGASQEDSVGSLRGSQGKLIEGQALTTSLQDASSGVLSESQGAHFERAGDLEKSSIVSDGSYNNSNFILIPLHVSIQSRN